MIAVISDIHGNLRALEAVLAEIDRLAPAQVVVGGDLALGGPMPAECVELVRRRGYPAIRGNTDEWLTSKPPRVTDAISWTADRLSDDDRQFLAGLPFLWRAPGNLAVVHATPWSISDVVSPDAPDAVVARVFAETKAAAVVYAHIHHAYIRAYQGKILANSGSVGLPFDGDQRSAFIIVRPSTNGWIAEIMRVKYDIEAAIKEAQKTDNPERDRWVRRIRNASF
jgi:predicted phosphodiesterase